MSRSFYPARLNRRITLTLAALVLAALAITAFGVGTRFSPTPPPQEADAPLDARAEVFTLTPTGFEPAEVTLPAGQYLLVFNNRTGLDEFALRLDREGHGTVREARPPRRKRAWREVHKLTPGTYVVTETSHPEWSLRLTVTPH
jgi:hypothetical protein